MYRARSFALFYCEILRCKIKNSFHSCKNKNKFWKASNGYAAAYPVRQATGLSDKPQNFVLACLLGRKFSFDLFCRFARFVGGIKKAIVIKRLLFCYLFYYLFCGLLFLKSSKRFCKASFVSVSISFSFSIYSFPNQSGSSFAFRF